MSHIFEHFYNPLDIINKIIENTDIKYVYICHPDFDSYTDNNTYNILTIEHTFYIENNFLIKLMNNYGFLLLNEKNINNYAVIFEFKRCETTNIIPLINNNTEESIKKYYRIIINIFFI